MDQWNKKEKLFTSSFHSIPFLWSEGNVDEFRILFRWEFIAGFAAIETSLTYLLNFFQIPLNPT